MKDSKKNFSHFFKRFWPLGLLLLIVLGFFWKVVLLRQVPIPGDFIVGVYFPWLDYKWGFPAGVPVKNPITTDVVSFTYPMQTLAMSLVKNGIKPLWNPYILAGSPLLANFQSAPFAPTSFVYFIFDKISSWSLQVILQYVLASFFTYLLLRYWKVSKLGSVLGGIIFAFSGYNIIFGEWNGHTLSAAFIPLVLLFEDRLLEKGKILDGAVLSVALALQIFSGYTQTSLYTVIAMGLLWLFRIIGQKKYILKTSVLAVFCFIALGLSAIQILPSYELIVNSQRDFEPHPYEWAFLPWKKTITFISPDYFGNHVTRNYWGPQDYTSNTGYVGIVAFVLGTLAIVNFRKNKTVTYLSVLVLLSLLLSFATPLSVFLWADNIFGMKANSAHRATVLFCAAMAFLAGFGFDFLTDKFVKYKDKLIAVVPVFVLFIFFGIYAYVIRDKTVFGASVFPIAIKNMIPPLFILIAVSVVILFKPKFKIILLGLAVLELFYFGLKYTPFSPREFVYPQTPILTFLESQQKPFRTTGTRVIPSNLRMAYQIEAFEGYDTFHPLGVSRFIASLNSGRVDSNPTGRYGIVDNDVSPLLDLVNVKYYLALKNDIDIKRFDSKRFKSIFEDKSVEIFESKTVLPRAFMVFDWEVETDDIKALGKLLKPGFPMSRRILISENLTNESTGSAARNSVIYKDYQNQESVIKVATDKGGLLFVSDSYYPGWKAYVDGSEAKIYKADSAFRAVFVPQGNHEVKFVYHPESFELGLKITAFSGLVIIALIGYTLVTKRKKRR